MACRRLLSPLPGKVVQSFSAVLHYFHEYTFDRLSVLDWGASEEDTTSNPSHAQGGLREESRALRFASAWQ